MTRDPMASICSAEMPRRTFLGAMAGGLLAVPLPAEAQPRKIPRLCFLTFDPGTPQSTRFTPFFRGLRDLGYVDGRNIAIDYLSVDGQAERFPTLAADCLRLKADVIVVTTTPGAQAEERHPHDPDRLARPRRTC